MICRDEGSLSALSERPEYLRGLHVAVELEHEDALGLVLVAIEGREGNGVLGILHERGHQTPWNSEFG